MKFLIVIAAAALFGCGNGRAVTAPEPSPTPAAKAACEPTEQSVCVGGHSYGPGTPIGAEFNCADELFPGKCFLPAEYPHILVAYPDAGQIATLVVIDTEQSTDVQLPFGTRLGMPSDELASSLSGEETTSYRATPAYRTASEGIDSFWLHGTCDDTDDVHREADPSEFRLWAVVIAPEGAEPIDWVGNPCGDA